MIIYIADTDGTLTSARIPMTEEFKKNKLQYKFVK